MQAQRIEKECSMLIGHHTLLHEPFPPAARLSVLVVSMWAAASRRVGCTMDLNDVVIKPVRSLHSRVRSHLNHEVKGRFADSTIYGLGNLSGPEARAVQVEYLLKNDRFLSPTQHYEETGVKYPEFLEWITPTFICLISTAIWHGIRTWSTGTYVKPDHFQSQNESVVKKKGITIELILEDGFSENDEALAADLAAFRNARKVLPSALVGPCGSDNGGGQEELVHAQLRGIEAEEEGEENEEKQEEGDHEGGEKEEDVYSTCECFEEHC
ncbi:hypothetical protein DFP73DRAFT_530133 [Morchella snyderi]|nr:hypothetical protein DFP73DRAFT_530133 [Morchella snyderi]